MREVYAMNQWYRVLAVGMCVFLCAASLRAQSGDGAATVSGTVNDVAGKPIPGAAVSVKNESNGSARQATTGTDGRTVLGRRPSGWRVYHRGVGAQLYDEPSHGPETRAGRNGERFLVAERWGIIPNRHRRRDGLGGSGARAVTEHARRAFGEIRDQPGIHTELRVAGRRLHRAAEYGAGHI